MITRAVKVELMRLQLVPDNGGLLIKLQGGYLTTIQNLWSDTKEKVMAVKRQTKKSNGKPAVNVQQREESEKRLTFNRVLRLVENEQFSRSRLIRDLNDPRRNINHECGYPETERLTIEDYKKMYDREAVAARVVEVEPVESWQVQPEIFETEDPKQETEFEKRWDSLGSQLRGNEWFKSEKGSPVWEYLLRVDKLSGIGAYGILLIGIDDGKELEEEAEFGRSERKLTFLRAFDQSLVQITRYDHDVNSPRFGQPIEYSVSFSDMTNVEPTEGTPLVTKKVHWTRIIHVADNKGSSEIFAVPRQRPVFNRLLDIRKLYGGSAEMYWKGAFMGLSFETHPQLGGDVPDLKDPIFIAAMKSQIENYENGLQRHLSTSGMTIRSLAPQVEDPTSQIDAQIKAICIEKGIPKRVFEGSERGELASSQDNRAWHSRLKGRQNTYLTPFVVAPFVNRLINLGVLPEPKEYFARWPDLDTLTDLEQATVAVQRTEALAKYVIGDVQSMIPPFDYLVKVLGFDESEAESMLKETMKELGKVDTLMDFGDNDENEDKVPPKPGENSGGNG